jgi:hypothetical protein
VLAAFLRSPQNRAREPAASAGSLFIDKAILCDVAGRVLFNANTEVLLKAEDCIPTSIPASESPVAVSRAAHHDDEHDDDLSVIYVSDLDATVTYSDASDSEPEADSDSDADTAKTEVKHDYQMEKVELEKSRAISELVRGKATKPLVDLNAAVRLYHDDRSGEDFDCGDPGVWLCCFDDVSIAALDVAEEDPGRETAIWGEGCLANYESCKTWATQSLR